MDHVTRPRYTRSTASYRSRQGLRTAPDDMSRAAQEQKEREALQRVKEEEEWALMRSNLAKDREERYKRERKSERDSQLADERHAAHERKLAAMDRAAEERASAWAAEEARKKKDREARRAERRAARRAESATTGQGRTLAAAFREGMNDDEDVVRRDDEDVVPRDGEDVVPRDDGDGEYGVCTVCLDTIDSDSINRHLACKHSFHEDCIKDWISTQVAEDVQPNCPTCRSENINPVDAPPPPPPSTHPPGRPGRVQPQSDRPRSSAPQSDGPQSDGPRSSAPREPTWRHLPKCIGGKCGLPWFGAYGGGKRTRKKRTHKKRSRKKRSRKKRTLKKRTRKKITK